MKILSIDTSSSICAVAILENDKLLKEISQNNGLNHSVVLMPMIQELLSSLNLELKDINLIVCDKGPGSFTGIRIGVATAKAFSDSLNIPAIGISSLESLAYNITDNSIICSIIDAKNDNIYSAIFEKNNENYILKRNFSFESIYDLLENLKKEHNPITFVGDGSIAYKDQIFNCLPNSIFCNNNELSAYNLGLVGLNHISQNSQDDLLPLYLRKSQAEIILEGGNQNGN